MRRAWSGAVCWARSPSFHFSAKRLAEMPLPDANWKSDRCCWATKRVRTGLPIEILEQRRPSPVSRSRGLAATRTQMETEMRADSATALAAGATADGGQAPVLERVFSQSIAARLLVGMPMVTIGSHNFPVMLTGATAAQQAQGGRQDAQQATFTGFTLDPVRLTARYLFAIEDVYKMADFEDVLRRDLAATISDRMDYQIVNGDGNAPNVNGFLNELAAPANPGAKTDFTSYAASYTTKVDGLNAYNLSDIRAVIGAKTYEFAETLTNTQRDMTAQEYMEFRTGGISVSNRVPAPSSDIQTNILALTSYPGMNAVAPIWSSLELIRDPYTNAAEGQIALTAIMLWNFKIVRETGFGLFKTKVA